MNQIATPPWSTRAFFMSLLLCAAGVTRAQEVELERPGPPRFDPLEVDGNGDGVPDGWYNLRDVKWVEGGVDGKKSHCFRFENARPGRPGRASRAFGVDGRKVEAVIIGLWVKLEKVGPGERLGDDPGLIIDFLGDQLRANRRGSLGPWTKTIGNRWTRVVKRMSIPPSTRDAILSVGLLGATGVLEIDDLSIELVPIGGDPGRNLVANGGFELGDPAPAGWVAENGARRVFPGRQSSAAIEMIRPGARVLAVIGQPLAGIATIQVGAQVRPRDLQGVDASAAALFFLDDDGRTIPGAGNGLPIMRWAGTSDWVADSAVVEVPPGATRAVLQFEKTNGSGSLLIDDVVVTFNPQPDPAEWRPYHVETGKSDWMPVEPSKEIVAGSALDASALLDAPAGKHGFVTVKDGRLSFKDGGRARFFGVQFLAPTAFLEPERSDALADRLARSGVNLVRLGDLDTPLGPGRSLFDDTREDTKEFDPDALARLDHLIAAFKKRGIYVALELQSARRFRPEDDVPSVELLPLGGGPASIFDPKLRAATLKAAGALLGHVNPETGLALKDDPVLAWLTIFGEVSLFDLIDDKGLLPPGLAATLNARGQGRSAWQRAESAGLKEIAEGLRGLGVKAPIAGVSHWRRENEFGLASAASGLDLIDDRLYWTPSNFLAPERRSLVWSRDGGLIAGAGKKRKTDRPYVVGQWCDQTSGAWSLPYEGADLMLAALTASVEDWDAIVRRGIFINPKEWGASAPGTSGAEDIFAVAELVNAIPPVYSLLPHAASILLQGRTEAGHVVHRKPARSQSASIPGWDPRRGRLAVDTPHTAALAGWPGSELVRFEGLSIEVDADYAVVAVSSLGREPISSARRLLVTAVARVEPTGFAWVDAWKRDVADIGQPPLLAEPVRASVVWRRAGNIKAYALDAEGNRTGPALLEKMGDAVKLILDGRTPGLNWELVVE